MNTKDINTVIGGKTPKDYSDFYNLDEENKNKNTKANNILTVILAMVITAIIIVLIIWGYQEIKKIKEQREAMNEVHDFTAGAFNVTENTTNNNQQISYNLVDTNTTVEQRPIEEVPQQPTHSGGSSHSSGGGSSTPRPMATTYKGYPMIGTIEIPSLKINYPVLDKATDNSLKVSIGVGYSTGPKQLNIPGNVVLMGHNYRNGQFFSNLKNIENGAKIYITDLNRNRVEYEVYNIYKTSSTDFDYATRKTNGRREITLSTCTDDVQSRIIVWAKAVG